MVEKQKITRRILAKELAYRTGLSINVCRVFLDEWINLIQEIILTNGNINIHKFGKFSVKQIKPYFFVSKLDGSRRVEVPSYKKIKFKPSRVFFELINNKRVK